MLCCVFERIQSFRRLPAILNGASFFLARFSKKVKYLTSNVEEDFSQLSFELYNVFVTKKMKILGIFLEFKKQKFALTILATSRGHHFDLSDLSRISNFS
jgi:hypothetical protein